MDKYKRGMHISIDIWTKARTFSCNEVNRKDNNGDMVHTTVYLAALVHLNLNWLCFVSIHETSTFFYWNDFIFHLLPCVVLDCLCSFLLLMIQLCFIQSIWNSTYLTLSNVQFCVTLTQLSTKVFNSSSFFFLCLVSSVNLSISFCCCHMKIDYVIHFFSYFWYIICTS